MHGGTGIPTVPSKEKEHSSPARTLTGETPVPLLGNFTTWKIHYLENSLLGKFTTWEFQEKSPIPLGTFWVFRYNPPNIAQLQATGE